MFAASRLLKRSFQVPNQKLFLSATKSVSLEGYGTHVFKGDVAAPYLTKAGLPADVLDTPHWTSNGNADKV